MGTDYLKMAVMNWWKIEEVVNALFEDSLTERDKIECEADRFLHTINQERNLKHKEFDVYKDIIEIFQDAVLNDSIFSNPTAINVHSLKKYEEKVLNWMLGPQATIKCLELKIIPYMKAKGTDPSKGILRLIDAMKPVHQEKGNPPTIQQPKEELATKPQTIESVEKESETTAEPPKKKINQGGNPGVDPDGKIAAKIRELKLDGIEDDDIPWNHSFTKLVQSLKKNKIQPGYLNVKIHLRFKKKEYTQRVGISLDTAKKLIKESAN